MAEGKFYLAIGEEATRGTKEASTVGFVPILSPTLPEMQFNDVNRDEFRGDDTSKGATTKLRRGQAFTASVEMPMFIDAGSTTSMIGTMFKHQLGHVTSTQNASTGQFFHMFNVPADPYAPSGGDIDTKALTLNYNRSREATEKNYPFVGARGSGFELVQEVGSPLMFNSNWMGQFLDTVTAEIGSATYADENLRIDFDNATIYTGTVTRTGSGPDYTDIGFGSGTVLKPDNVTITFDPARNDKNVLDGTNYPSLTSFGRATGTLSYTIDLRTSGFDSEAEYDAFMAGTATTNFAVQWDTGTEAGTLGDNYMLIADMPKCVRTSAVPEWSLETNQLITMEYEFLLDSTTGYALGIGLKNESTTV
jgi:hypothetical protein